MSRKKEGKEKEHIYFESKKPGRDSVFGAVEDVGRKGVDTKEELFMIAGAQLADLGDLKTKDHSGKSKKWSHKLWGGRSYILWKLFYKLKKEGKVKDSDAKKLKMITSAGHKIMEIKDKAERVKRIKQVLKKAGLKDSEIKKLLEKTN